MIHRTILKQAQFIKKKILRLVTSLASTYNTFRDITIAKLQSTKLKKGNNSKSIICFFLIFTKYSTHRSLSANTGFKSLAFILFEIFHLQNCDVKFQNFQSAITQEKSYNFFKFHHIIYSLYSISC